MDEVLSLFSTLPKRLNRSTVRQQLWRRLFGLLAITLVTAIWGYSNVVMRQGEAAMSPSVLIWMRFGLAGVVMLPTVVRLRLKLRHWCIGVGTGVLLGLCVLAQCFAMLTVSVDEVAFLTALYVVFTPLAMSLVQRRSPSKAVWAAIALSLGGATLLIGKFTLHMHIGVLWALAAAIGLSGQIIGTKQLANAMSSVQLAGLQSVSAGATLTCAVLIQGLFQPSVFVGVFHWSTAAWLGIAFLAILATVVAVFLQAWGQARISATEAAVAFNMEPVWTALFAWVVLVQGMTALQMIGALCIVSSLTVVTKSSSRG